MSGTLGKTTLVQLLLSGCGGSPPIPPPIPTWIHKCVPQACSGSKCILATFNFNVENLFLNIPAKACKKTAKDIDPQTQKTLSARPFWHPKNERFAEVAPTSHLTIVSFRKEQHTYPDFCLTITTTKHNGRKHKNASPLPCLSTATDTPSHHPP